MNNNYKKKSVFSINGRTKIMNVLEETSDLLISSVMYMELSIK